MTQHEYKVIAAPTKGQKAPGAKSPEARFALAVETLMNDLAAEGWRYLRSDLLPSEERQGLTSSHIVYRSVLVFYRETGQQAAAAAPAEPAAKAPPVAAPPPATPAPALSVAPISAPDPAPPLRARPRPVNDVPDDPFDPR